jgi:hypothetical protein
MKDNEGGGTPIGGGDPEPATQTRPPTVHGEQRLQALLEEAESEIADLEARVAELEGALAAAELSAAERERGRAIERELTRAGAIDLEAAGLLLHAAIGDTPDADIAAAVRDLKGRKPFLFAPAPRATSASMGPADAGDELGDMATSARGTGDRAALLRYLRRRRAV